MQLISMRLPDAMITKLEELAKLMAENPTYSMRGVETRSDVIREVMAAGILQVEKELNK